MLTALFRSVVLLFSSFHLNNAVPSRPKCGNGGINFLEKLLLQVMICCNAVLLSRQLSEMCYKLSEEIVSVPSLCIQPVIDMLGLLI